jgi:hypothetical protein
MIGCGSATAQVENPLIAEAGKAAGMALICSRGHPTDLRAAEKGAAHVQSVALKQGGAVAEAVAQASIQVGTLYAQANPEQCTNVRAWFERAMKALNGKVTNS